MKTLTLPQASEWNNARRGERPPLGRIVLGLINDRGVIRYGLVHATMTHFMEGKTPVLVELWIALPETLD